MEQDTQTDTWDDTQSNTVKLSSDKHNQKLRNSLKAEQNPFLSADPLPSQCMSIRSVTSAIGKPSVHSEQPNALFSDDMMSQDQMLSDSFQTPTINSSSLRTNTQNTRTPKRRNTETEQLVQTNQNNNQDILIQRNNAHYKKVLLTFRLTAQMSKLMRAFLDSTKSFDNAMVVLEYTRDGRLFLGREEDPSGLGRQATMCFARLPVLDENNEIRQTPNRNSSSGIIQQGINDDSIEGQVIPIIFTRVVSGRDLSRMLSFVFATLTADEVAMRVLRDGRLLLMLQHDMQVSSDYYLASTCRSIQLLCIQSR